MFSPNSFWYKEIPADAPLHENSVNFNTEFNSQITNYYGHVSLNYWSYSAVIYTVDGQVPRVPVTLVGNPNATLASQFQSVPIPTYAVAPPDTDGEMCIYQPSTDTLWEFWKAVKVDGAWRASWGGCMNNVSKNAGIWTNPYGARATGLPILGGTITAEELDAGEINHVMAVALVHTDHYKTADGSPNYSWPANRSDGYNPTHIPNYIPEGLRFRLDPTIDVESLSLNPVCKTIARAAQKYGFVVWDKGGAVAVFAEDGRRYTSVGLPNPWTRLLKGIPSQSIFRNLPWDKMQFLPKDYGKTS